MMTIYERIVLESLTKNEKTLTQLSEDVGLKTHILESSLSSLVAKGHIRLARQHYVPTMNNWELKKLVNTDENLCAEISFLQRTSLELTMAQNAKFLKLRKANLNPHEQVMFGGMLANLEAFLNSVSDKGKTKDATLVYWCSIPMQEIINRL